MVFFDVRLYGLCVVKSINPFFYAFCLLVSCLESSSLGQGDVIFLGFFSFCMLSTFDFYYFIKMEVLFALQSLNETYFRML